MENTWRSLVPRFNGFLSLNWKWIDFELSFGNASSKSAFVRYEWRIHRNELHFAPFFRMNFVIQTSSNGFKRAVNKSFQFKMGTKNLLTKIFLILRFMKRKDTMIVFCSSQEIMRDFRPFNIPMCRTLRRENVLLFGVTVVLNNGNSEIFRRRSFRFPSLPLRSDTQWLLTHHKLTKILKN